MVAEEVEEEVVVAADVGAGVGAGVLAAAAADGIEMTREITPLSLLKRCHVYRKN